MIPVSQIESKEYCRKQIQFLKSKLRYESGIDKQETETAITYYEEMLKFYVK